MVKINYKEHSKEVELAGQTIADVRELFESEYDLSDHAKANLNGRWVKRKHEAETALSDEDELFFEEKSRRPLAIVGALLLALVLTGAVFAYTSTTSTTTITVSGGSTDFCSVSGNATSTAAIDYTLLGKHRGVIGTGILFDAVPDPSYTGDIVLNIYISNVDQLQNDYSSWMMRLDITDNTTGGLGTIPLEIISLDTPGATFEIEYDDWHAVGDGNVYIYCDGGSYKTYGTGWLTSPASPLLYAQVVQAGDH